MVQLPMVETSCCRRQAALTGINPNPAVIMPGKTGLFQRFSEPQDAQGQQHDRDSRHRRELRPQARVRVVLMPGSLKHSAAAALAPE